MKSQEFIQAIDKLREVKRAVDGLDATAGEYLLLAIRFLEDAAGPVALNDVRSLPRCGP